MTGNSRTGWMMSAVLMASLAPLAAQAVSLKACSLKYAAAKTAGTLNGQDWKTFRAAQCSAAAPAAMTPVAATATAPAALATAEPAKIPAAKVATGSAAFPAAIDPKYAKLSAGKGRMKTCLDQYHANKALGGNGGLNWIAKDGYYSQCNTKLKGT